MCGGSLTAEERVQLAASKLIDQKIREEEQQLAKQLKMTIKLLLLGAGESGKSTVLKQMKMINGVKFTDEEISTFRITVVRNLIASSQTLVEAMEQLKIPYGFHPGGVKLSSHAINVSLQRPSDHDQSLVLSYHHQHGSTTSQIQERDQEESVGPPVEGIVATPNDSICNLAEAEYIAFVRSGKRKPDFVSKIQELHNSVTLSKDDIEAIRSLWNDSGVQYCFQWSNEYQLIDCCAYFMSNLDRCSDPKYTPTENDILQARVMTTTITETTFNVSPTTVFRVFDVGGQRSERKKWAPYFQDVKAIIFLIAISSFDQVCQEDTTTNRMVEALNLFASICNHPMFKNTSLIVFMNKIDLFKQKLETVSLAKYFPTFTAANTFEYGTQYFANRVTELNKYQDKQIYLYFTWATDTKQIKSVLSAVNTILLGNALMTMGMM